MKSAKEFMDNFILELNNRAFDNDIKAQNEEDKRFIESLIFDKNKLESGESNVYF